MFSVVYLSGLVSFFEIEKRMIKFESIVAGFIFNG